MLIAYGIGKMTKSWHVLETKAPMFVRVYYILGGKTTYRSGPQVRELQPGMLYLFPSQAPYEMTTDPEDPLECMHLHLDLHMAELTRLVRVDLREDPPMRHLIRAVRDGVEADNPSGYLESLVEAFEKLCLNRQLIHTVDGETRAYIQAIRDTYRTDTPLRSIAASLGYSTEYFIRAFRKKLGVPPHQYAISLRMSDAVRMLAAGDSLEQIAGATGYADGQAFANAFRRYYGISPSSYRENYAGSM